MNIEELLQQAIQKSFEALFSENVDLSQLSLQPTKKEFDGSHTFVTFPFLRTSKKSPEETGRLIGEFLQENTDLVANFNVVKGFLNLTIKDKVWIAIFKNIQTTKNYGVAPATGQELMVEYSSPNTNKPLHLGHLRNNFLGNSVSRILDATGYEVKKVQIINDRGIHICKSMVAWQQFGNNETPESTGLKGDKFVGNFYVKFDQIYKEQIATLLEGGKSKEEAEKESPILVEAQEMLVKWEQKDPEVYKLWEMMNGWVYEGFETTYKTMGVDFDKLYYESETYLLGKDIIKEGLDKGIFYQNEDSSVWVDLTAEGLDQKILQRSDGTSVYMTQDIGTAIMRFNDFPKIERQIYTVGNEQDYHFKVLFIILEKLGYTWAKDCFHLSYGMVDLPSGKMKSREGTVVDADDLMATMIKTAEERTVALGKIDDFNEAQAKELYYTIAIGALKYFILKVDPKKRMLFNPEESIDFHGNTAPFIQYTHARISSILRKAKQLGIESSDYQITELHDSEVKVIVMLANLPQKIALAAAEYAPYLIAQYAYDLVKEYNRFYAEVSIFNESDEEKLKFRIAFSEVVAQTIKSAMNLLGIDVPERM